MLSVLGRTISSGDETGCAALVRVHRVRRARSRGPKEGRSREHSALVTASAKVNLLWRFPACHVCTHPAETPPPPGPVPQANWSDIATGRVTRAIRTPVRPPTIVQNEPARRLRLSLEPRPRRTSRHHSRLPLAPCTPPRPAHHALNRGGIPHRRTASHEIGGVGLAANLTNTPPAYTRAPLWPERTGMRRHSLQATFS